MRIVATRIAASRLGTSARGNDYIARQLGVSEGPRTYLHSIAVNGERAILRPPGVRAGFAHGASPAGRSAVTGCRDLAFPFSFSSSTTTDATTPAGGTRGAEDRVANRAGDGSPAVRLGAAQHISRSVLDTRGRRERSRIQGRGIGGKNRQRLVVLR